MGLNRPYGLAIWQNYLYVAETNRVRRFPYDAKALTVGAGQEIVQVPGGRQPLDPRDCVRPRRSADMRSSRAARATRRASIGIPTATRYGVTVIERDGLGDDLPPDYFTHVQPGGYYGWPWAYFGPHPEPRHNGQHAELVRNTITPDVARPAHNSPLDFAFYTGTQFPAEYRGGAFITLHGTWNRAQRAGYKVVYVPFQNGRPVGTAEGFSDWLNGCARESRCVGTTGRRDRAAGRQPACFR